MLRPRILLACLLLVLGLPVFYLYSAHAIASPVPSDNAGLTIAVADFSGSDRELGRFLADALLTDLAQSRSLHLLERSEIRQALNEVKLQASGLAEPQQVKRFGKLVGADRLVVGGYLLRDGRLLVNARVLDVRTGRLVPGGAAHQAGDPRDLLTLTHALADQLHLRLTGSGLSVDNGSSSIVTASHTRADLDASPPVSAEDTLAPLREGGLLPDGARANGILTEKDLAVLLARVARLAPVQNERAMTVTQPGAPVTRLRALVALVKLTVPSDELRGRIISEEDRVPPDMSQVPPWGTPHVVVAVERDWWPADRLFRPRDTATWAFVGMVVERMSLRDDTPPPAPPRRAAREEDEEAMDGDAYTGLIVDARDFHVQRTMSVRVLDEDGRVVYPDSRRLPGDDYLMDRGLASYYQSGRDARRAGERPLVVRAVDISGPGRDNLVVTNETAERIARENRRSRFLGRWAVAILVNPGD